MTPSAQPSSVAPATGTGTRGHLALAFQEILTVTTRLREGRRVPSDASAFRSRVRDLLAAADQEARRRGYPGEFVKSSVYAVVAFLDETVLGTPGPLASAWAGRPLQEEIFGDQLAGERFFQNLNDLLGRQDSTYVADVLEVHLLCLQLGFRGRYTSEDSGELRSLRRSVEKKILRIRGGYGPLSPRALPPAEEGVTTTRDPWIRRLSVALLASAAVVLLLMLVLRFLVLAPGAREIRELASTLVSPIGP